MGLIQLKFHSYMPIQLKPYSFHAPFNTQYIRNPDMVYVLKMEYISKIHIFGIKMMVKSGLEKIFWKFLHVQGLFQTSW